MASKDKDLDLLALLEKAASSMDDPDTATTDELLSEFFVGLETVLGEMVATPGTGPITKSRLTSMNDVLSTVAKMSDSDLNQWLRVYTPTPAKVYDGSKDRAFAARTKPGNPDGGIQSGDPATGDPTKNWNPTTSGGIPGSSQPSIGLNKSMIAFLNSMTNATPEEIDRAKTGLSQLDPDVVATLNKAVAQPAGKLIQSLDAEIDDGTEAVLRRGELLSERELRKSILVNSAHLIERVARMRDQDLAKRMELTSDPDDTFESEAFKGNVGR